MFIKWKKVSQTKGTTAVIISMNAFLLLTVLALFITLKPEDPLIYEQFRSQLRIVYLISFITGNGVMFYIYKKQQKQLLEEQEEQKRIKEEEKLRRREARKNRV
ncbi:MAG: hypothetical protein CVU87_03030 [Firmicutes bacterium HGW-Firmicutes-12]|nr:MAG: hypothetical protein CVU87_03030 [Firmicutes bacterium HGW-Firmicutes-12]